MPRLYKDMKNNYILYIHTSPSGKKYVGITCGSIKTRANSNGSGYKGSPRFWNAIQKYGWGNILHEIRLSGLTEKESNDAEKYYIKLLRTTDDRFGYNITEGGDGCSRGKNCYSPEYRKKQSHKSRLKRLDKVRQQHKDYMEKHREQYNEYQNTYYHEHLDTCKEHRKKYEQSDKGKAAQYKANHSEANKIRQKRYYEAHKEEIAAKAKAKRDAERAKRTQL